ncbi:MAG: hypothetical protein ABEL76_12380 [Bradymonadaceae bacterium]
MTDDTDQTRREPSSPGDAPTSGDDASPVADVSRLREYYDENPYAVLAAAAGAGYVVGGGLFTPFTKRLLRIGMKAVVVPATLSQLEELTQEAGALETGDGPPEEL